MAVGGSRKGALKQWATKTRTGCITCKKRRVKCDEGTPICQNCTNHSVACEGYEDLSSRPPKPVWETSAAWQVTPSNSHTTSSSSSTVASSTRGHAPPRRAIRKTSHYSAGTIVAWLTRTLSPYQATDEQLGLKAWLQNIKNMGRSEEGLTYWTVTVPTLAWSYDSVRHAQTAAGIIFDSLHRQDSPTVHAKNEALALTYASKAIRAMLTSSVPPEVAIVVSTVFWLFEICMGHWLSAMQHLVAGHRISQSADLSKLSEPRIPLYVRSFYNDLPPAIHPSMVMALPPAERKEQFEARKRYAKNIMQHAYDRTKEFQAQVEISSTNHRARALRILGTVEMELYHMIQRWPINISSLIPEKSETVIQKVVKHSPFVPVLRHIDIFFVDDDEMHLNLFEVQFRPSLDLFVWLAACEDLQYKQLVMKLWTLQRPATGLSKRVLDVPAGEQNLRADPVIGHEMAAKWLYELSETEHRPSYSDARDLEAEW